jgi:hypothetical protein
MQAKPFNLNETELLLVPLKFGYEFRIMLFELRSLVPVQYKPDLRERAARRAERGTPNVQGQEG